MSTNILLFHKMISTKFGDSIKRFHIDNPRDYFNQPLCNLVQLEGIVHESSCIDTPQRNRVAEQKVIYLLNVIRSLLYHHHVRKYFYGEAVLIAVHLINQGLY